MIYFNIQDQEHKIIGLTKIHFRLTLAEANQVKLRDTNLLIYQKYSHNTVQ